jgi:hypothetical protein
MHTLYDGLMRNGNNPANIIEWGELPLPTGVRRFRVRKRNEPMAGFTSSSVREFRGRQVLMPRISGREIKAEV